MRRLDSFQMDMTSEWEGMELTYSVAWQSPDSFQVLHPDASSHGENGEKEATYRGTLEVIAYRDAVYIRKCPGEAEGCEPWQDGPRERVYLPMWAPGLDPMWPVELLGLASEARIVGSADVDGVACTGVQFRANTLRAIVLSARRVEEEWGPMYLGEGCVSISAEPEGETEKECHETTLDDQISLLSESMREQDQDPPLVEVWIGREDSVMRRLRLPERQAVRPDSGTVPLRFSRFNEVEIKPPR